MTTQDASYEKRVYRREILRNVGEMFRRMKTANDDFGVLIELYKHDESTYFDARCIHDAGTAFDRVATELNEFVAALEKLPIEMPEGH